MSEGFGPEPAQKLRQVPQQTRRSADEDRAWAQLYADIVQPAVATEVVKQLDVDQQAKRSHLALYIRARTTLQQKKAADARNQRIGAFVRQTFGVLVFGPFRLLRSIYSASAAVAIEALPPVHREPAKVRTPVLKGDPDFAPAKKRFRSTAGVAAVADAGSTESRSAKAA
jgi:hypothetical protein